MSRKRDVLCSRCHHMCISMHNLVSDDKNKSTQESIALIYKILMLVLASTTDKQQHNVF